MKVSPGCSSARNTAWFIWLPEFGCTLAKLRAEQFLGALDRQRLGDVDPFAAAIVARARIALGVFVGHHRALRFQHRPADDVFGRDQLDLMALAAEFALDRGGDLRIGLGERGREERVGRGGGLGRWRRRSWAKYLHRRKPVRGKAVGSCVAVERSACEIPYRPELAKHLRFRADIYARYGGEEAPRRPAIVAPGLTRGP